MHVHEDMKISMLEKAFMHVHTCVCVCMCGHVFCECVCHCLAVLLMFSMSLVVQEIKQGTELCVSCLIRLG